MIADRQSRVSHCVETSDSQLWSAAIHRRVPYLRAFSRPLENGSTICVTKAKKARMNSRTPKAVLVWLALLPCLLAADGSLEKRRSENYQRVGNKTAVERQRLEENLRTFQKLPAEEQARLRQLQAEIEHDPDLKVAFENYQTWANTLSPGQRNELRRTTDPRERQRLIEQFQHEPPRDPPGESPSGRPPSVQPLIGGPGRGDRGRLLEKLLGRNFPLGDRMGSSVPEMEAIVHVLEQQLSAETRAELDKFDSYSRKVRVVRLTMERHPLGPPPVKVFGTPDSPTFEKVLSALPDDGQVKQTIRSLPNPEAQRAALFMALIRGLSHDMQRTVEDHLPSGDALRRYSETLSSSERQRLNDLKPEERMLELQQRYLKERVPGIQELQEILTAPIMGRFFRETMQHLQNGPGPRGAKGVFPPPDVDRPGKPLRLESNSNEDRPPTSRDPDRRKEL